MGKRKERRLAAMMSANRRFKLDLFAEPSDSSDIPAHAEDGNNESKSQAGLPISPSSSGQQIENPLLLLGQYSDDEGEESSKGPLNIVTGSSSLDLDDQAIAPSQKKSEIADVIDTENHVVHKDGQRKLNEYSVPLDDLQKAELNATREVSTSDSAYVEIDSRQASAPEATDTQVPTDVILDWKMVLHEESNQYYYWNVITGETSWEVPAVLAQEAEATANVEAYANVEVSENQPDGNKSSPSDEEVNGAVGAPVTNFSETVNSNLETNEKCKLRPEVNICNEGDIVSKTVNQDINQGVVNVSSSLSTGPFLNGNCSFGTVSEICMHNIEGHEECEPASKICSDLVKHGEYLLEKLKSLEGSDARMQQNDWIRNLILEVEIRLSDIKLLSSHGSSLHAFWKHSASQLKNVEVSINSENVATYKSQGGTCSIVGVDTKRNTLPASEDSQMSTDVQKESHCDAYNYGSVMNSNAISFVNITSVSGSDVVEKVDTNGVAGPSVFTSKVIDHTAEDVDMDVDMEVDEAFPSNNGTTEDQSNVQHFTPLEQSIVTTLPEISIFNEQGEEFVVPPPPNEEWIPPPPPDDEPFPPPPPDDPPEPTYSSYPQPPSDMTMSQPFSYTQQYSVSYPVSNIDYYVQTSTYPTVVPQPPIYYAAVSTTYPTVAPAVINTVATAAFFGLEDCTAPPVPGVSGVDSSGFFNEPGHGSIGSGQTNHVETACMSLSNSNIDAYSDGKVESTSVGSLIGATFGQASTSISVTKFASTYGSLATMTTSAAATTTATATTAATTASATEAASTTSKVKSKVSRGKKRTVAVVSTLRSNKKVSSLVDKWKAAKEELHEDDDDTPENAFELLERKRQREIEEWCAQQIASGEAIENANFQPLGGDWRERVKRKRASQTIEAKQSPSEDVSRKKQQSDSSDLSKDLPPGWQAYWDETSKQVYYAHAATLETTWVRPTI